MDAVERIAREKFTERLIEKLREACNDPDVRLVAVMVDRVDPNKEDGGLFTLYHNTANPDSDVFQIINHITAQILISEAMSDTTHHTVQ